MTPEEVMTVLRMRGFVADSGTAGVTAQILSSARPTDPVSVQARNQLLNSWRLDPLLEASIIVEDWRYNTDRPRSAHGDFTPTDFAAIHKQIINPQPHANWTTKRVLLGATTQGGS